MIHHSSGSCAGTVITHSKQPTNSRILCPGLRSCVLFYSESNEVGGSYHMEIEGLKRMVNCLEDEWGFVIGTLVTDRHRQIGK